MNRRDTIIIAVLLNAGLLAILFLMAINMDDEKLVQAADFPQTIVDVTDQTLPVNSPTEIAVATSDFNTAQSGDEIDNALKQFADNPQLILVDDEGEPADKEPLALPPAISTTPPQNPEPPPSTQPPQSQRLVEVTVKKGDALEKIARANNATVEAIKKANDLTSTKLKIGQVLKIPVGSKSNSLADNVGSSKPVVVTKKPADSKPANKDKQVIASNTNQEFYTVKSGDNPWKIAKQFHVKFDELLKLNNLDEEKARNLKIGDKLRVK